jgi:hypothetical protein
MKTNKAQTINVGRIVGFDYYGNLLPNKGDDVLLVPEPHNEADVYAVAVYNTDLVQIGHIAKARDVNKYVFSKLCGEATYARVSYSEKTTIYPIVFVDIRFMENEDFQPSGAFLA